MYIIASKCTLLVYILIVYVYSYTVGVVYRQIAKNEDKYIDQPLKENVFVISF